MPHWILHNQRYVIQHTIITFFFVNLCKCSPSLFCLFVVTVKFEIDEVSIFLHTKHQVCNFTSKKETKHKKSTHYILCIKCSVGSTDQAYPSCFYFRISWILMEHSSCIKLKWKYKREKRKKILGPFRIYQLKVR